MNRALHPSTIEKGSLLGILVGSLFFRLYRLGDKCFWYDEIESATLATSDVLKILDLHSMAVYKPPLHTLLLHLLARFETGETWFRLPSVLFSLLSVFLVYKLGKALFNHRVGILAALFMAVSPFDVLYAQQASPYAMYNFFTLLSIYTLLRAIKNNTPRHWVGFGLVTGISLYVHYYSLLVIFFESLFILSATWIQPWREKIDSDRATLLRFSGSILLAACLFLPWLVLLFHNATPMTEQFSIVSTSLQEKALQSLALGKTFLFDFVQGHPTDFSQEPGHFLIGLSVTGLLIFFLFGIQRLFTVEKKSRLLLCLWVLLPLIVVLRLNLSYNWFQSRHILIICPALLLIVALGVEQTRQKSKPFSRQRFPMRLFAVFPFFGFFSLLAINVVQLDRFYQEDSLLGFSWKEAASFLFENRHQCDCILLGGITHLGISFYLPPFEGNISVRQVETADEAKLYFSSHQKKCFAFMEVRTTPPLNPVYKWMKATAGREESTVSKRFGNIGVGIYQVPYVWGSIEVAGHPGSNGPGENGLDTEGAQGLNSTRLFFDRDGHYTFRFVSRPQSGRCDDWIFFFDTIAAADLAAEKDELGVCEYVTDRDVKNGIHAVGLHPSRARGGLEAARTREPIEKWFVEEEEWRPVRRLAPEDPSHPWSVFFVKTLENSTLKMDPLIVDGTATIQAEEYTAEPVRAALDFYRANRYLRFQDARQILDSEPGIFKTNTRGIACVRLKKGDPVPYFLSFPKSGRYRIGCDAMSTESGGFRISLRLDGGSLGTVSFPGEKGTWEGASLSAQISKGLHRLTLSLEDPRLPSPSTESEIFVDRIDIRLIHESDTPGESK